MPAPPRHPGELCLGQLPAGSTLGSQAPLQSRCCTRRRLLRTLHIYPQALSRTGATRAQLAAFGVSRARTHCRHTRVHVCAHTCGHATLAACTAHLAHRTMGFNIFAMLAGLGPYAQARASAVLTPVLPSPYPRPDEGPYACPPCLRRAASRTPACPRTRRRSRTSNPSSRTSNLTSRPSSRPLRTWRPCWRT